MKTTFTKREANPDFNHQVGVVEMFEELGFDKEDVRIQTSLTNGVSHYINVDLIVTDPGKIFHDMFSLDGLTFAKIRISDHNSNLSRFGQVGNDMTFPIFEQLIKSGAVAPYKG